MIEKSRRIFVLLAALIMPVACANAENAGIDAPYELPGNYSSGMEELRDRVEALERLIVGARFEQAEIESRILLNISEQLKSSTPGREFADADDYEAFLYQTGDLAASAQWLLYYIRLHRRVDAHDTLGHFAERYNRISKKYGPKSLVSLSSALSMDIHLPEEYRGVKPGERMYR